MDYSKISSRKVMDMFHVNEQMGLSSEQAKQTLLQKGENKLSEEKAESLLQIFLNQFKDFLVLILLVASIISIVLEQYLDGSIILLIVMINSLIGTIQERKAGDALKALKELSSPQSKVIRNGNLMKINSHLLVEGDVILLEAGDFVPADLRLIETMNLKIDESALTGESVPVLKKADFITKDRTNIGDKLNMAFMGTVVSYGRAKAIVVSTGMHTEMGKIAGLLNASENEQTPLQVKLDQFGKMLGILCVGICLIIFLLGISRGVHPFRMFMDAVALAVAAIPEGLTVIVTVILAMGMQKMVRRNAIIKKLAAVETLGSTTVICSDKTGTLTQNKMTVTTIFQQEVYDLSGTGYKTEGDFLKNYQKVEPNEDLILLLKAFALCNDAVLDTQKEQIIGDPTEASLLVAAAKAGYLREQLDKSYPRIDEIPFDSERKLMSTLHETSNGLVLFTKGAPDRLLLCCDRIQISGKMKPLTKEHVCQIEQQNEEFAKRALRVLAVAYKPEPLDAANLKEGEKNLVFLGLAGLIDPPRPEVKSAVETCKAAGIRPVMITGDHKITASAIAIELGIITDPSEAMDGNQLDHLSEEQLREKVVSCSVFARVSPEHKVKLVEAIKANQEVVAMTGDGVNDAPALKRADIGIAMGITGTDVSKEAADMILTDDNFASIVHAVEEGRIIYSNIRKVIGYLLSCNIGEILLVFIATLFNWPLPLAAIHLLSINLITDALPAFALGLEGSESGVMDEKPRKKNEALVNKTMLFAITIQSIALAFAGLASFAFAYYHQYRAFDMNLRLNMAQSYCFLTVVIGELLRAYSARSEHLSIFKMKIFENHFLNKSVIASICFLMLAIKIPAFNSIFKTANLKFFDMQIAVLLAVAPVLAAEFVKVFRINKASL